MNKHFIGILNPHDSYYNGYEVHNFELSKDGTKVRYENNHGTHYSNLEWEYMLKDFKSFEADFKKYYGTSETGYWGVRKNVNNRYEVLSRIFVYDDDFDDIVHIKSRETYQFSFDAEIKGSKTNIVDNTNISVHFNFNFNIVLFTSAESAMKYLEKKFIEDGFEEPPCEDSLLERFKKWADGNAENATELWKDYNGTTKQTEWAIENNIDYHDFDTWQAVQRVLKHELSYDEAMKVDKVLYEMDLSIFDCE